MGKAKMNARIETWRAVISRFFFFKMTAMRTKTKAPTASPMGMWVIGGWRGSPKPILDMKSYKPFNMVFLLFILSL